MKYWQILEAWIDRGVEITRVPVDQFEFRQSLVRDAIEITRKKGYSEYLPQDIPAGALASRLIQAYLDEQRKPESRTKYVIRREGRTSTAVWVVGCKTADVRGRHSQFAEDLANTVENALFPDFRAMEARNPRARLAINAYRQTLRLAAVALGAQLEDIDQEENA